MVFILFCNKPLRYKLIDEESAAREAAKSPKGKKASAKPKNEKSEDVIEATPEPVEEPEPEEKLQQLYISTPDGTHYRFGINNGQIFVRLLRDHDKVSGFICVKFTLNYNLSHFRNLSDWYSLKGSTENLNQEKKSIFIAMVG